MADIRAEILTDTLSGVVSDMFVVGDLSKTDYQRILAALQRLKDRLDGSDRAYSKDPQFYHFDY